MEGTVQLSREELYELVWSKPLSQLAKEFEVSDVGLGKLCSRMGVPRPGQGYWAQRPHRRQPQPLPPQKSPKGMSVVELRRRVEAPRRDPPPKAPEVPISRSLETAHPLVAWTARGLARASESREGVITPRGKGVLEVAVTPELRDRALLILDSLVKALEKRGHSVEPGEDFAPRTLVEIGGELLRVSLKERLSRAPHEPTIEEEEKEARGGWSWAPRYDWSPTGQLRVRIEGLWACPGSVDG